MVKTYQGGTVDLVEAQRFREYAKKYYGNNQSLALEIAIRCLNKHIESGVIPKINRDITETIVFDKS